MLTSIPMLPERAIPFLCGISGFLLTFLLLCFPPAFLPRDHGRAFAVNGEKSKGKLRGVGLLFILCYILLSLLFLPLSLETGGYLGLLFFSMLFGYLDDASKTPWSDYLKGALDLVISVLAMLLFLWHNEPLVCVFNRSILLPQWLYFLLGIVLIWVSVNVVNCSDGVDGLCGSVSIVSMLSFAALGLIQPSTGTGFFLSPIFLMTGVLLAYLWFNLSPSSMLMGDAGSRAIGFFLALLAMKSGHPLAFIPLVLVMLLDGGLGLIKVFFLRFFHISFFKNTRMPLHDHFRKTKGWSDTQVVGRFVLLQLLISLVTLTALFF